MAPASEPASASTPTTSPLAAAGRLRGRHAASPTARAKLSGAPPVPEQSQPWRQERPASMRSFAWPNSRPFGRLMATSPWPAGRDEAGETRTSGAAGLLSNFAAIIVAADALPRFALSDWFAGQALCDYRSSNKKISSGAWAASALRSSLVWPSKTRHGANSRRIHFTNSTMC